MKADTLVRVRPFHRLDLLADGGRCLELLADLAAQGLFEGFAGLGLAAGEFPEAGQMRTRRPPRDEDLSVALDHRGYHLHDDLGDAHAGLRGVGGPTRCSDVPRPQCTFPSGFSQGLFASGEPWDAGAPWAPSKPIAA